MPARWPRFYKHFTDKSEILIEVLSQSVRPSVARFDVLAADLDLSASRRLAELVQFEVRMLLEAPWNVALLSYLPEVATAGIEQRLQEQNATLRAIYRTLVSGALTEAGREPGDTEAVTDLVVTLVEGVILRREQQPPIDGSQFAADVADAVLAIIAAPRKLTAPSTLRTASSFPA